MINKKMMKIAGGNIEFIFPKINIYILLYYKNYKIKI